MGALKDKIPITHWTMFVGSVAIAGIPGLAGFFSKDEILWQTYSSPIGSKVLYAIGLITALPVHAPTRTLPSRALAATLEPDLLGCFAVLDATDRLAVANGACLAIRSELLREAGKNDLNLVREFLTGEEEAEVPGAPQPRFESRAFLFAKAGRDHGARR